MTKSVRPEWRISPLPAHCPESPCPLHSALGCWDPIQHPQTNSSSQTQTWFRNYLFRNEAANKGTFLCLPMVLHVTWCKAKIQWLLHSATRITRLYNEQVLLKHKQWRQLPFSNQKRKKKKKLVTTSKEKRQNVNKKRKTALNRKKVRPITDKPIR